MKKLPESVKLLKLIKKKLDELMADSYTKVEIRSTDLYDYIKKDPDLNDRFPKQRWFNQFLIKQHDKGIMKQFIPNYRADTSKNGHYEWFFRKEIKNTNKTHLGRNTDAYISNYKYHNYHKNVIASNGEKLRSNQEVFIYERLLKCDNLEIFYDHPISKDGEIKYTDFFIKNKMNHKTYYWEHFGMTNNEQYKEGMAEAIRWYRLNGYKMVDDGGNLIYTYYTDEKIFNREVLKYIEIISEC